MRRWNVKLGGWLLLGASCVGCTAAEAPITSQPSPPDAGRQSIRAEDLERHIKTLASDQYEGRAPASNGEELTIKYLADEFKKYGLPPGNTDGTYFQKVPLVSITADPTMSLVLRGGGKELTLTYGQEVMGWTKRVVEETGIEDSPVIFVGYGIEAPELDWNDFKAVDVRDKTLIVLVNDPPIPDPNDPSRLDPSAFGGDAMTYYGRWTYKFELAAQKGARGCFIIHETGPAGYPWEVVSGSWSGEQFDLVTPDKNMSRCAVEGWLTYDSARKLFQMAGQDLEALKKAAIRRDFKPVSLGVAASLSIKNTLRTIDSNNVIAKLDGSDPNLKNEYVVYMAHWDHLGQDPTREGDQIFNGALDNASGTGGLLELAEAVTRLETPPRRSIVFLAVTAEEQGLLGSRYYAENPIYPLVKTVAAINMDGLNVLGQTHDIVIIGKGNSTLDDVLEEVAGEQGLVVKPDPEPGKGFFYRSDHFNFAKHGVPALYTDSGVDYVGRPEGWGLEMRQKYTREDYHKPSDEYKDYWDLSGAVQELRLLFEVGYRVANRDEYPEWKPGTEFKARREQMLREAGSIEKR